jgi:putative ABC transport system ATP-binding protein
VLIASEAEVAVAITVSKIATKNQERFVKESILEVQNITKEVNSPEGVLTILKDVNLTINTGDVTSIVGPSGSGKTTLLAIMAGLDLPSRGRIKLIGHEITTMNEDKRAQVRSNDVGFVFQSFHLLPRLSALDNVMLPLEILGDKNAKNKSMEALSQIGLEKRVKHLPNQLSGGEKQRVAIARAMVKQPKILFADEPTGNLDKASTEIISDLLFSINHAYQTTIVIVTHDLLLAQNCQTMHELDEGSLKC